MLTNTSKQAAFALQTSLQKLAIFCNQLSSKSKSNQALNALLTPLQAGGDYSFYFLVSNAFGFTADFVFGATSKRFAECAIKIGHSCKNVKALIPAATDFTSFEQAYLGNNYQLAANYLTAALNKMKTALNPVLSKAQKYDEITKLAEEFSSLAKAC